MIEPAVEPGQQEAQRAAARQQRQGGELGGVERAYGAIARQQQPRLGDIEAAVALEAPGVETDGEVIGEKVGAGEVEVDEPRDYLAAEEDIVGEEIGVDHALRQMLRPLPLERLELAAQLLGEA